MYAEMLGQIYKSRLYKDGHDPDGYQEVDPSCDSSLSQAFVFHARHTTFYIFYAKIPNKYLKDIATYGADYKTRAAQPDQVIIQQSRPYRMRVPKHQAAFFKLLSDVLYYIVSGSSSVGVLAAKPWNKYYRHRNTPDVIPEESGSDAEEVNQAIVVYNRFFMADSQIRPVYDCIRVRPFAEKQTAEPLELMDEDGKLDDESDAGDSDLDEDEWMEARKSGKIQDDRSSSWDSREGSPMDTS